MPSKNTIDLRTFELDQDDFIALLSLEDKPNTVVIIAEKIEDGVSHRRMIEFPEDPLVLARMAEAIMQIADITQISYSKRKDAFDIQFGKKHAKQVFDRTR